MAVTQLQAKYKFLLAERKRIAKEKKLAEGRLNNIVTDAQMMEQKFAQEVEKIKEQHEKKLAEFQKLAEEVTTKQQDQYHEITLIHTALTDVEAQVKVVRELLIGDGHEVEEMEPLEEEKSNRERAEEEAVAKVLDNAEIAGAVHE